MGDTLIATEEMGEREMLGEEGRERVAKATIRLPKKGGQGVVVANGLILTAAHCIDWSPGGGMVLGDFFLETIVCDGRRIRGAVLAVEPVSDIAVLGSPHDQAFPSDALAYEDTLELVEPVEVSTEDFDLFRDIPAAVYTHEGTWLEVMVQQCSDGASCLWLESTEQIEPGTSGSPILDQGGHLLGVVSNTSIGHGSTGNFPRPHLALPVWVVRQIVGNA